MNTDTAPNLTGVQSGTNHYTILRVDTSSEQSGSINARLTDLLIQNLEERVGTAITKHHFLSTIPVEQINENMFEGIYLQSECRNREQIKAIESAMLLANDLKKADILVFNIPVYSFGIPRNFKAYLDLVARLSHSGLLDESDFHSIMAGKEVFLVTNKGTTTETGSEPDTTCHSKHLLSFLGIREVEVYSITRGTKTDQLEFRLIQQRIEQELLV